MPHANMGLSFSIQYKHTNTGLTFNIQYNLT